MFIEEKRISPSCKPHMRVSVSVSELACMCGSRPCMRERSATHSAEWQDLEQIFCRLLQHGNMCKRREGVMHASLRPADMFMHVCRRPTEAARFCVRKGTNKLPHPSKYANTDWRIFCTWKHSHACMAYTMVKSVLLRWMPSLNSRSKLNGQYTDVKSGSGISVGPSLKPHSLS